jgi:tungstate transport system ATP-binding protein
MSANMDSEISRLRSEAQKTPKSGDFGVPASQTIIEIRNLLVKRGKRSVLEIDELDIQKGAVLAIIGPNGAGKTSLLLALARLLKPERGQIHFNGYDDDSDLAHRRRIGLVMQDPLLLNTSVFENVATGLRFRGLSKAEIAPRVNRWLERLGIPHLAKRPASQISGGEAQRVSLARVFVLEPELLLLDEPFSSLDPETRTVLRRDLRSTLQETRVTTIFVTHDLEDARALANQVATLKEGKLHWVGSVDEFLE